MLGGGGGGMLGGCGGGDGEGGGGDGGEGGEGGRDGGGGEGDGGGGEGEGGGGEGEGGGGEGGGGDGDGGEGGKSSAGGSGQSSICFALPAKAKLRPLGMQQATEYVICATVAGAQWVSAPRVHLAPRTANAMGGRADSEGATRTVNSDLPSKKNETVFCF